MKTNKYNPKIPVKNDGQYPADWRHPQFDLRVIIYITPLRVKSQAIPPTVSYNGGWYISSPYWTYYYNDYTTPYQNTIELLDRLMPGPYVVVNKETSEVICLYCNEWLDPVVLKLAPTADKPTGLNRVEIEHKRIPVNANRYRKAKMLMGRI